MSRYSVTFTEFYLYPGGCIELSSYDEIVECELTEVELTTINLTTCETSSEWVDIGETCCEGVAPVGTAVDALILEFSEINTTTCETVEQSCEYMDECPPDLVPGLCCGCDTIPRFWQLELSGIVDDTDGTLCDFVNGTFILWYYFDDAGYNCYWKSTAVITCPGGDYTGGHGTICSLNCYNYADPIGFRWTLSFSYCYNTATSTCIQTPTYQSAIGSDMCTETLTLDMVTSGDDCCTGWPATITLVAL